MAYDVTKPLAGIRIVEAAQMIAAPFGTSILCDQGAEVIKVEANDRMGDRMRALGDGRNGMGSAFHSVNRGKQSVALNTKDERGAELLRKLIDTADVFVQNFRPGAIERMGAGYDAMKERKPNLIYVSVSGFGRTGPHADQMVYDYVIQGITGLAALEGMGIDVPDGEFRPRLTRSLTIDKATGLTVAQAITAALFHRERTGEGQHIEINMLEAGMQFLWPDGGWNDTLLGDDAEHSPHLALNYDVRPTKDGYITVNLATHSTWPKLAGAIDPGMMDDPRFDTYEKRLNNGLALAAHVDSVLATRTSAESLALLREHDVPAGPVLPLSEVHTEPQVVHNEVLVERESATIGKLRDSRPAVRFDARQPEPGGDGPILGQDTDRVLAELGCRDAEMAELRADRVIP